MHQMKYQLLTLLLFSVIELFAADTPLTGLVLNSDTKEPLPFANIAVVGKNKGTVSNSEGIFILDMKSIDPSDTVLFSYIGFQIFMIKAEELQHRNKIYLHPVTINLKEVKVSFRDLSAKEIIKRIISNYEKNYPKLSRKQDIFFHSYEKVPFDDANQIIVKESDFNGLDKKTIEDLIKLMPREFIEYQDAVVELYSREKDHKLIPVKGISLEEGSQKAIYKEVENKLEVAFDDIHKTMNETDTYYKIRSGVLSHKMNPNDASDSLWNENKNDSLNYTVKTSQVKNDLLALMNNYGDIKSKNWEFINKTSKYRYSKELLIFNGEPVYAIRFTPKDGGMFSGIMYVTTQTYAILQLDFAYDEGKQSETFQILGFGHAMNFKKGRVIFEQGNSGYYIKYINAQQKESASVDRKLSIMKKQKRFLADKELNEIKMEFKLTFDIDSYWEMLVLEQEEINSQQFNRIEQPLFMKFKKEYAYTPEMWNDRTVIAPSSELKKFKRK